MFNLDGLLRDKLGLKQKNPTQGPVERSRPAPLKPLPVVGPGLQVQGAPKSQSMKPPMNVVDLPTDRPGLEVSTKPSPPHRGARYSGVQVASSLDGDLQGSYEAPQGEANPRSIPLQRTSSKGLRVAPRPYYDPAEVKARYRQAREAILPSPRVYPTVLKPKFESIINQPNASLIEKASDIAGYANDKTYGSAQRLAGEIKRGLKNIPTRISEALDPNDAESRGDQLITDTDKTFGLTPAFKSLLRNSNPVYADRLSSDFGSSVLNGSAASGVRKMDGSLHRIEVTKQSPSRDQRVMHHEGLHDAYGTLKDGSRQTYFDIVDRALRESKAGLGPKGQATPSLQGWVNSRTGSYKANRVANFTSMAQVPESLRNEVHSYVPEYYESTQQEMPNYLKDYYANFYNTGGRAIPIQRKNGFEQLMERVVGGL